MMKEAPGSSETSVLTRATRRNNPEDTILQDKRYLLPNAPQNKRLASFAFLLFDCCAARRNIPEDGILRLKHKFATTI
jgi:hypothetical protein